MDGFALSAAELVRRVTKPRGDPIRYAGGLFGTRTRCGLSFEVRVVRRRACARVVFREERRRVALWKKLHQW